MGSNIDTIFWVINLKTKLLILKQQQQQYASIKLLQTVP